MNEQTTYGIHVTQYPEDYSLCTGCHSCEMICSLLHDGVTGPCHGRIKVKLGELDQIRHEILTCLHCTDHPCYDACPKKDSAMCISEDGIVYIVEDNCIGCGKCQLACKFTPSRINFVKSKNKEERKAKKCDLCRNRAEGPACIQFCPNMCLGLSNSPLPYEIAEKGDVKTP